MNNKFLPFAAFITIALALHWCGNKAEVDFMNKCLKQEFKGTFVKKFHQRGDRVIILTDKGEFEISTASDCLYETVRPGDTLEKPAGSNTCFIRNGTMVVCNCYYFDVDEK